MTGLCSWIGNAPLARVVRSDIAVLQCEPGLSLTYLTHAKKTLNLSVAGISRLLGYSQSTVRKWLRIYGLIPDRKFGAADFADV